MCRSVKWMVRFAVEVFAAECSSLPSFVHFAKMIHGKSAVICGRSSIVAFSGRGSPPRSFIIAISDAFTASLEPIRRATLRRTGQEMYFCLFFSVPSGLSPLILGERPLVLLYCPSVEADHDTEWRIISLNGTKLADWGES